MVSRVTDDKNITLCGSILTLLPVIFVINICLVILSTYISIYSKVEDYKTENKARVDTEYKSEHGSSLDFNFISLPSPAVDEN